MNYLRIGLLIFNMYLNMYVFPHYYETLFNPASANYLVAIAVVFLTKLAMSDFSSFTVFFISISNTLASYFLIKGFYFPSIEFPTDTILIQTLMIICFYYTTDEEMSQIRSSPFQNEFSVNFICNIIGQFTFMYFHKFFHYNNAISFTSFSELDITSIITELAIDVIILNAWVILVTYIRYYYEKNKSLKPLYKYSYYRVVISTIGTKFLFYLNHNSTLSNLLYTNVMKYIPQPTNLIIYNCLPLDPNVRYRMSFGAFQVFLSSIFD